MPLIKYRFGPTCVRSDAEPNSPVRSRTEVTPTGLTGQVTARVGHVTFSSRRVGQLAGRVGWLSDSSHRAGPPTHRMGHRSGNSRDLHLTGRVTGRGPSHHSGRSRDFDLTGVGHNSPDGSLTEPTHRVGSSISPAGPPLGANPPGGLMTKRVPPGGFAGRTARAGGGAPRVLTSSSSPSCKHHPHYVSLLFVFSTRVPPGGFQGFLHLTARVVSHPVVRAWSAVPPGEFQGCLLSAVLGPSHPVGFRVVSLCRLFGPLRAG
jgi:hypothetical protein